MARAVCKISKRAFMLSSRPAVRDFSREVPSNRRRNTIESNGGRFHHATPQNQECQSSAWLMTSQRNAACPTIVRHYQCHHGPSRRHPPPLKPACTSDR
ncbi:hypothetical protein PoB_005067100 [Plakobranchus ocellatus]|uniref:Uncharacterized protein n=1 Tax=Plakobranchus ocellatus TaxID=259542 RepID=A0AAV4BYG9_9GAST|nr:hypothetical protein PoB_005067100 [Plakobranchus ocellatus]